MKRRASEPKRGRTRPKHYILWRASPKGLSKVKKKRDEGDLVRDRLKGLLHASLGGEKQA